MMQVEFVVAFLGITWARAVAAPLNSNYKQVTCFRLVGPRQIAMYRRKLSDILKQSDHHVQDEFKFYLEDASSKLLVVPAGGNANAEAAAADQGVPVASFSIPEGARLTFASHSYLQRAASMSNAAAANCCVATLSHAACRYMHPPQSALA